MRRLVIDHDGHPTNAAVVVFLLMLPLLLVWVAVAGLGQSLWYGRWR